MPIASQVLFHAIVNHQYTKILYCTTTKATLQLLRAVTQGESFPDQTSCLRPVPKKCCQDGRLPASHWERWCITTMLPRLQSPNHATLNDRQAGCFSDVNKHSGIQSIKGRQPLLWSVLSHMCHVRWCVGGCEGVLGLFDALCYFSLWPLKQCRERTSVLYDHNAPGPIDQRGVSKQSYTVA